jgi:uncharacterized protein YqgC (DUF456 family)
VDNIILIVICSLLMLVGLFGIVLPFVPGVPLVWLGLFIYALLTGFKTISIAAVVIFFILMAFTLVLDLAGPLWGLRIQGADGAFWVLSWVSLLALYFSISGELFLVQLQGHL